MQLEPWVPLCVIFGWWFSPWELWGYWLVDIAVPPMGLQIPSAPSVLSLTPPLGGGWGTALSPMSGCVFLSLFWSGFGSASQETAISGSSQQALVGIHNSVWVCCLHVGWIPRWAFDFLILAILMGVRWNLRVVLICTSLMTKDFELFKVLLSHLRLLC